MHSRVQYLTTMDGARLAWCRDGRGPVVVKAANWLTHLQYDWESPLWRHWLEFLAGRFDLIRYDERGCGLSDHRVDELSESLWLADLERVMETAAPAAPVWLLGISQGAATVIRYAVHHPERVAGLILYGGYARGWALRSDQHQAEVRAVLEMMRVGWGSDNPAFRQTFTGRFVPGANHEQLDWFNELCRRTTGADTAVRLLQARGRVDVSNLLDRVRAPTLVIHAREDQVVPFAEGQALASGIPGAEFVALESRNHILLADEPAWEAFRTAVEAFTGVRPATAGRDPHADLTRRQRDILDLVVQGLSNREIAARLGISEKTVRNHLTGVYRKLGVGSRAAAIVAAYRGSRSPGGEPDA